MYLQTGENCEETNSDNRAWRCRYAGHRYRFICETDKRRGLWLRRLSRQLLCITDIALIQTAKPPEISVRPGGLASPSQIL
jgi:hypothetical protein